LETKGAVPGMNENVLDVLMYLFETYVDTEDEPEADQNELRDELSLESTNEVVDL
jgi:hypothetical protein